MNSSCILLLGDGPVQFGVDDSAHQFLALVAYRTEAQFLAFNQGGTTASEGFIHCNILTMIVLQYDVHELIRETRRELIPVVHGLFILSLAELMFASRMFILCETILLR